MRPLYRSSILSLSAACLSVILSGSGAAQEVAPVSSDSDALKQARLNMNRTVPSSGSDSYTPSPVTRVGVQTTDPLPLSLADAIRRTLSNNNDIEVSRVDVRISKTQLEAQRGVFDPVFTFAPNYSRSSTTGSTATNDIRFNTNFSQFVRPGGGSYQVFFNNSRTENAFAQAQLSSGSISGSGSAIYSSALGVSYTQPLFRNRKIDSKRQQLRIAKKRLEQTDTEFSLQAISTITAVQRAYWDLVLALRDQQNRVANLNLAKENLRLTEARIDAGIAAPLERAELETEVATREGDVLSATQNVTVAENALKQLLIRDPLSPEWRQTIVPTDLPVVDPAPVLLDDAMRDAMDNRFELKRLKLAREINQVDIEFYRDQTRPQVDLNTTFSLNGFSRGGVTTASTFVPQFTGNSEILRTRLNTLLPVNSQIANPLIEVPGSPSYLAGGFNRSLPNLFRSDAPNYSVGVTFSFPLRNRTAKANLEGARITEERLAAQTRAQEEAVMVDVRNAVQALETARQRVFTARRARQSAEVQLAGERRLYDAGRSTTFLLLQRENALTNAKNAEIRAETDYTKANAELQRVTVTTFRVNGIQLDRPVDLN